MFESIKWSLNDVPEIKDTIWFNDTIHIYVPVSSFYKKITIKEPENVLMTLYNFYNSGLMDSDIDDLKDYFNAKNKDVVEIYCKYRRGIFVCHLDMIRNKTFGGLYPISDDTYILKLTI